MRLNQFVFLLASTVVLGAIFGIVTSLSGVWLHLPWFVGLISGAFLATTSLMGFWAYLTLNFISSFTLPRRVWRWTQGLLVAVVLYDMLWWRYHIDVVRHPSSHATAITFMVQGLWPLAVAVVAGLAKQKLSGKGSFLPSVFYLYVFTIVDWLLVIRSGTGAVVNQTGFIMMLCNVYLLLVYGKLLSPASERMAWVTEAEAQIDLKKRVKVAHAKAKLEKKARRRGDSVQDTERSSESV